MKEVTTDGQRYIICFNAKQDLKTLQEITIEDKGKMLAVRTECTGACGKVFQTVGVAPPPTIREI